LANDLVNEEMGLVPQVLSGYARQSGAEELLLAGDSQATRKADCKAEIWGQFVGRQIAEPCKEVVYADLDLRDTGVWSGDNRVEEEEARLSMDEFGG